MPISKQYLRDKFVLLLVSVNIFLAFLTIALVLLRIGSGQGSTNDYIVQYRADIGISAYKTGSVTSILSFALFMVLVATSNIVLSMRTYHLRRFLSVSILGLGALLLVLALIVSNLLLVLR